jgi:hypothetical protein
MAEQLISTAEHDRLPDSYVRPETQRPRLHEVIPDAEIPVVDLADPDRAAVVARVAEACRTHGFFQVGTRSSLVVGSSNDPLRRNGNSIPSPPPSSFSSVPRRCA